MVLVIERVDLAVHQNTEGFLLWNSSEIFQFNDRMIARMDLILDVVDGDDDVVRSRVALVARLAGVFIFVLHISGSPDRPSRVCSYVLLKFPHGGRPCGGSDENSPFHFVVTLDVRFGPKILYGFFGPRRPTHSQVKMTPQAQTDSDEDEIKYLLLSTEEKERQKAAAALFDAYKDDIMRCIEYHHPGLNDVDKEDVLFSSIERFLQIFPTDTAGLDRPLKPRLLRTVILVGKEKYRKIARTQKREVGDLLEAVTEGLKDSEFGKTWHQVADESFRQRVRQIILETAASFKPRQRQIAFWFAERWAAELPEKDAINEIFLTTNERLTRDQFKRALDEVRKKLREPVINLLIKEGICPKNLTREN